MGILDKFKRAATPRARVVTKDLARLDALEQGLGAKASDYVLSGVDETVLATIATKLSNDELELGASYVNEESPTTARRRLLTQQQPVDLDFTLRYARVLAAGQSPLPDNVAGSKHVSRILRVLFSEVFYGVHTTSAYWKQKTVSLIRQGVTLKAATELVTRLEGDMVDFADLLYHTPQNYYHSPCNLYREAIGHAPWLAEHVAAVIEAAGRVSAKARGEIIEDVARHKLIKTSHYLAFVVALAGDASKAVRETARSALTTAPASEIEPVALEQLASGTVARRAGMVELLAQNPSEAVLIQLKAHREKEKTARINAAIDTLLTASAQSVDDDDDETGYVGMDGQRVDIPPLSPLPTGEPLDFRREDEQALAKVVAEENRKIEKRNEETKRAGHKYRAPLHQDKHVRIVAAMFKNHTPPDAIQNNRVRALFYIRPLHDWAIGLLARMPLEAALRLCVAMNGQALGGWRPRHGGAFGRFVCDFLDSPEGDVRHIEAQHITGKTTISLGYDQDSVAFAPGDLLRFVLRRDYYFNQDDSLFEVDPSVWPYIASNLAVYDEAFGLAPATHIKLDRLAGVQLLQSLPSPPRRYFAPLLEVATGETKAGRTQARQMLKDAPGVDERIVALLDDSRQAVRAGAADWIASRRQQDAATPLKKRLKREKSEIARAAMLSALDALGEDLAGYIGPEALQSEAEKGLKRAKLDKLEWLGLDHLPALHFKGGARVPKEVPTWWLFLAVKLKQPGGNALFDIYLDQLAPADAETLSSWVLESWINYDTATASEDEANAYAKQNAPARQKLYKKYYENFSLEDAFAQLKREVLGNYLNSGAATKGLLALAGRAPAGIAADHVQSYLKKHGSRTSQASSLLELMAAMGDPVTLQVVIAAATRLKQKGVQKFAGSLVDRVAEARDWSMDELADRTIPVAGLAEDGRLELVCGEDEKCYTATLDDTFKLVLQNPAGKTVKSLPAGKDDNTKAAKKQLSASRRELKQVVGMQTARLYEALCAGRVWPLKDFTRDFYNHPVMRQIVERIVWIGLDSAGESLGAFRPTAEGDFTNAEDEDVDIATFSSVRLAHGARMLDEEVKAWEDHLADYEVKSVFAQFGRSLLTLTDELEEKTHIEDRKGWVTDTFTIRGIASKLGYERGESLDGGYFNEYLKPFASAGVAAVIEFSGNCLPEENVAAATMTLSFERYVSGKRRGGAIKLKDVPPVLLSECWNDYRALVAKGAFDENWEKKMPWM